MATICFGPFEKAIRVLPHRPLPRVKWMSADGYAEARDHERGNAQTNERSAGVKAMPLNEQPRRQWSLSLLVADVQPDHRPSGFADDTIAIAAPATFESSFGSEITRQETKQDGKNNQACNRKQHRIVKTHGADCSQEPPACKAFATSGSVLI